ncbi:hypothetical protein S40288_11225 [Stachybotrys chartarum IBT 40288]|nr:hypothetical protein S40288_11225 [Stachybotrys chartarum IBT 40288]
MQQPYPISPVCPESRASAPMSYLLMLPLEIIFLVQRLLGQSPECLCTLALTCKTFYRLVNPSSLVLSTVQRSELLALLEKDPSIGNRFYVCPGASALHRFSSFWMPLFLPSPYCLYPPVAPVRVGRLGPTVLSGTHQLGYHYARFVMNRHFYGAPCGIPSEKLTMTYTPEFPGWGQSWSARIIEDELFLCATHTIDSSNLSDSELRAIVDSRSSCGICRHVIPSQISAIQKPRQPGSKEQFTPCRESHGSCSKCLTDYCTTIERKKLRYKATPYTQAEPADSFWVITIVAYHQLGGCRSPDDWKWAAITTSHQDPRDHYLNPAYRSGMVRRKWLGSFVGQVYRILEGMTEDVAELSRLATLNL